MEGLGWWALGVVATVVVIYPHFYDGNGDYRPPKRYSAHKSETTACGV